MTSRTKAVHHAIAVLQRLSDLFAERREQIARQNGLTVSQWRVLEEVATEHFMPSLFARRRSVTPAAVSKLVRSLLDRGLIQASIAEGDRRQRRYVLSREGRQTLERVRQARQTAIDKVWADLTVAELRGFALFGEKLGTRLEAYLDD